MTDEVRRATDAHPRKSASDLSLEGVDNSAIVQLLRRRRRAVIDCLEELLQKDTTTGERNAAASAIATLKELERTLAADAADTDLKARG